MSKYGYFSGPYFPVFGLNTEIYEVNLHIQSEYREIRTRKNSVFGNFLRSGFSSKFSTSIFSPNTGKYGPEKTPYLDTFHAVDFLLNLVHKL